MSRVIHFEIQAENPERAIGFYSALFGWKFKKWEGPMPYWLSTTGPDSAPGINGGLLLRQGPAPIDGQAVNAYVCTIDVSSLDEAMSKAVQLGGQVVVPKMPISGIGWLAYAKDTAGNIFGVMQTDPKAA